VSGGWVFIAQVNDLPAKALHAAFCIEADSILSALRKEWLFGRGAFLASNMTRRYEEHLHSRDIHSDLIKYDADFIGVNTDQTLGSQLTRSLSLEHSLLLMVNNTVSQQFRMTYRISLALLADSIKSLLRSIP
jgi:hypothetical protein